VAVLSPEQAQGTLSACDAEGVCTGGGQRGGPPDPGTLSSEVVRTPSPACLNLILPRPVQGLTVVGVNASHIFYLFFCHIVSPFRLRFACMGTLGGDTRPSLSAIKAEGSDGEDGMPPPVKEEA